MTAIGLPGACLSISNSKENYMFLDAQSAISLISVTLSAIYLI
jgi:hypothetical protein